LSADEGLAGKYAFPGKALRKWTHHQQLTAHSSPRNDRDDRNHRTNHAPRNHRYPVTTSTLKGLASMTNHQMTETCLGRRTIYTLIVDSVQGLRFGLMRAELPKYRKSERAKAKFFKPEERLPVTPCALSELSFIYAAPSRFR
jgi:hypothetical protein